jgi:hypothetical protein
MKQVQVKVQDDEISVEDGIVKRIPMSHAEDSSTIVAFSEGTVLEVKKGEDDENGPWRVTRIQAGTAVYERTEADADKDEPTDTVRLSGGEDQLRWVVVADKECFATDAPLAAPVVAGEDDGAGPD